MVMVACTAIHRACYHQHSSSCYHAHTSSCYQSHTHTDSCYSIGYHNVKNSSSSTSKGVINCPSCGNSWNGNYKISYWESALKMPTQPRAQCVANYAFMLVVSVITIEDSSSLRVPRHKILSVAKRLLRWFAASAPLPLNVAKTAHILTALYPQWRTICPINGLIKTLRSTTQALSLAAWLLPITAPKASRWPAALVTVSVRISQLQQ